jgi:hypothetical protein
MLILLIATLVFAGDNKNMEITVFGSSTSWGNGLLDERSLVGTLDEHFRNDWSQSVYPNEMKSNVKTDIIKNRKFFRSEALYLSGKGNWIEFKNEGDLLAIWLLQGIIDLCDQKGERRC